MRAMNANVESARLPELSEPTQAPLHARVKTIAALPSLLTLGNGICGFAAIIALAKAYTLINMDVNAATLAPTAEAAAHLKAAGDNMLAAAIFIGIGMLCDMLDGRVARMTGTAGQFGAQLDSLCDTITFCAAPAMMLRVFGEAVYQGNIFEQTGMGVRLIWAVSALFLACGLLRLARFNVETDKDDDHTTFKGLPTPAAAGAVISLVLISYHFRAEDGALGLTGLMTICVPVFGSAFALLMVSRIRYGHLFNRLTTGPKSMPQMVSLIFVVALLYILFEQDIPMVFAVLMLSYILYGPIGYASTILRRRRRLARRRKQRVIRLAEADRGESDRKNASAG